MQQLRLTKLNCIAIGIAGAFASTLSCNCILINTDLENAKSPQEWQVVGLTGSDGSNSTAWMFTGWGVRSVMFERSLSDTTDIGVPTWLPRWMVQQAADASVMDYSEFGWPLAIWYNKSSSTFRPTTPVISFRVSNLIGLNILGTMVAASAIGAAGGVVAAMVASKGRLDSNCNKR